MSVSSPSPTATLSPTPTPTPTLAPTLLPSPTASFDSAWKLLPGFGFDVLWAPDSKHLLEIGDGIALVYDADAGRGRNVKVSSPSWLDNTHVVGVAKVNGWSQALITDIDSGETQLIRPPHALDYALGNGHGAVALSWARDNQWPNQHYSYLVWQDGAFGERHDGFPQTWSSDGSMLALLHQFGRVRGPGGWLSVVTGPDDRKIFADAPPFATGDAAFDPTGQYVAYSTDSGGGPSDPDWSVFVRVVDLHTQTYVDLPSGVYGGFYWNSDGTISIVDPDTLLARTYDPTGSPVAADNVPYRGAVGSVDGSTVVYWDVDGSVPRLAVIRNGVTQTMETPFDDFSVHVAPDGSEIAITSRAGSPQTFLRRL